MIETAVPCGLELERRGQFAREALAGLDTIVDRLGLSTRAWHRVPRVARTIAHLAGTETAGEAHVAEAVSCRALDRHDVTAA